MVKILVTEKLNDSAVQLFLNEQWSVDFLRDMPGRSLKDVIADYDALVIRSATRVTEEILAEARKLKVIGRPGVGVDNIDLESATRHGVLVMNTPGQNSIAAAEHTLLLMLAALRGLYPACASLKAHQWERKSYLGTELAGKTVGIIGFGRIGRAVAHRLLAFQCRVLAYDPYIPETILREYGVEPTALDELLSTSDIITLHIPLTPETASLLNQQRLSQVRQGTIIINCARGELIDSDALLEALQKGKVAAAGLDVFAPEPPTRWDLIDHPHVVATPHLGGSTLEAHEKTAMEIARQIIDYLREGLVRNAVNFPDLLDIPGLQASSFLKMGYALGQLASALASTSSLRLDVKLLGKTFTPASARAGGAAVLAGFLNRSEPRVNLVNARYIAEKVGISIQESIQDASPIYEHAVEVIAECEQERIQVTGTLIAPGHARLIGLQGVDLDVPLQRHMLFIHNEDVPGVIGQLGQVLAAKQVNIGYFSLARLEHQKQAFGILVLDSPIDSTMMESITSMPYILSARYIELDMNLPLTNDSGK